MSHAIACLMQLVLCNYTNLQLHVSHATEFQLHATIVKPKISSTEPKELHKMQYLHLGYNKNLYSKFITILA